MPYLHKIATQKYRSIFLSDFHIGSKNFNAEALLDFLRSTESHNLYLVGDIIDGWKLKKRWYWTETVSEIFDELFRKAHEGTKIIYITGNHDETVRGLPLFTRLRYTRRLGIQIKNRIVHKTADGRDFLIMHGDQFDRILLRGPVSKWGDRLYEWVSARFQNHDPLNIEIEGKLKRFSLSKFLSYHGQMALNLLNNYERALCREARRSDVDGIICGHTHIPALKKINAITYANCGAWLKKGQTAIVETNNGKLELLDWPARETIPKNPFLPFFDGDLAPVLITPNARRYRPFTRRLMESIRRTWPSAQDATSSHSLPEIFSATMQSFGR